MNRVLLVCEASNTASINTIERNGGDLEAVVNRADGPVARYWINVIALGSAEVVASNAKDPLLAVAEYVPSER